MHATVFGGDDHDRRSPFLRPDHRQYDEILTDAAVHLLATRGVDRFSVSGIARLMKVAPQAVLARHSRAGVIDIITTRFGVRWLRWSSSDSPWASGPHLVPLRLPADPEERHGVRVLAALHELARGEAVLGNPLPEERLRQMEDDERADLTSRLRAMTGRLPTAPEVGATAALLKGLRAVLADDPDPGALSEATRTLSAFVLALEREASPDRRPSRAG